MIQRIETYLSNLQPRHRDAMVLCLFGVVLAITYFRTLGFQYAIDDQYYLWLFIDDGSGWQEYLASLRQRFWHREYRPVTFATLLIEGLVFGQRPEVHHFFNLLYYWMLGFLVYKLLTRYFKKYEKHHLFLAIAVALFFILHPSHANVVSSIKNREVILSMGFGLLSIAAWWNYLDSRKFKWVLLSAVLLLIGMFAKRDVTTFLLLVPLSGYLYSGKFTLKQDLPAIVVFLSIVLGASIVIQNQVAAPTDYVFVMGFFENPLVGAEMGVKEWLSNASHLLLYYEKFMVWPHDYHFYFGFDQLGISKDWNMAATLSFMAHLALFSILLFLFVKNRFRYLLGPAIFFISLSPFLFTLVTGILSVRYAFIASLGFCIVFVQLILWLDANLKANLRRMALAGLIGILMGSAWFSYSRSLDWKNLYTLYAADLPKLERSVNANRMAGLYYYLEAEKMDPGAERTALLERSLEHAEQALAVYDREVNVLGFKAKALRLLDRKDEALEAYQAWVAVDTTKASAFLSAAYFAKETGNYELARSYFEEVLKLDRKVVDAFVELTQLYIYFGQYDEAIRLNNYLYESEDRYDALLNYGDIYIAAGDTALALQYYGQAVNTKQEEFIIREVIRISDTFGNDSLMEHMKNLLQRIE